MLSSTDHYSSASKEFFNAQLAAFNALTSVAMHGAEKIVALNMETVKASAEASTVAAKRLLTAKDPQVFFELATTYAKPNAETVAAYSHHLTDILSSSKEEFTKVIESQAAAVQGKVSDLVNAVAKDAPKGSENAMAMLKSSVANAHDGYEKMKGATKHVVDATQKHVAKAAGQATDAVKKATEK